jgi:hypothetical protein
MAHELEAAQVASAGGWFRFRPRPPEHVQAAGTPCANCATPLMGPWCHACGQLAEDFHRSWVKLIGESIEGVFHFDGRVWRTLPDLVRRPGRLTRLYLEGHRAPQIPPLRLFLVVLLLLFFVGSFGAGETVNAPPTPAPVTPAQKVSAGPVTVQVYKVKSRSVSLASALAALTPEQRAEIKRQLANIKVRFGTDYDVPATIWLQDRVNQVIDRPEEYQLILESWSERFAFLMLPLSALLLGVLFIFQRRFYIFDHLIFSMHSLSFFGLLISIYMIAAKLFGDWAGWLLLAPPVHLFVHMRGVYGTSILGTLARMTLLFMGSIVAFTILILGLMLVGMASLAPAAA